MSENVNPQEIQAREAAQPTSAVAASESQGHTYVPRIDMYETDAHYIVDVDLPGAKADTIDVQFEDRVLSIHAHVPQRHPAGARFLRREYGVGDYHREFRVGEDIASDQIDARYANGVLSLTLPKRESARRRAIEVKAS